MGCHRTLRRWGDWNLGTGNILQCLMKLFAFLTLSNKQSKLQPLFEVLEASAKCLAPKKLHSGDRQAIPGIGKYLADRMLSLVGDLAVRSEESRQSRLTWPQLVFELVLESRTSALCAKDRQSS